MVYQGHCSVSENFCGFSCHRTFKTVISFHRLQRLVSWRFAVWSGYNAAINWQKKHRRTKTPTALWTRRHLQPEATWRSSGAACWTRLCHSLIGIGPCLRFATSALRRLCWLWETVSTPSFALTSSWAPVLSLINTVITQRTCVAQGEDAKPWREEAQVQGTSLQLSGFF